MVSRYGLTCCLVLGVLDLDLGLGVLALRLDLDLGLEFLLLDYITEREQTLHTALQLECADFVVY